MPKLPPFIENPKDPMSKEYQQISLAWRLWSKMPDHERDSFIAGNPQLQTDEFTDLLRMCKAWWWLEYFNRAQIAVELDQLEEVEREKMRDHLNTQRVERKHQKQLPNSFYRGAHQNA